MTSEEQDFVRRLLELLEDFEDFAIQSMDESEIGARVNHYRFEQLQGRRIGLEVLAEKYFPCPLEEEI